jgi:hypothetical protein
MQETMLRVLLYYIPLVTDHETGVGEVSYVVSLRYEVM